ncbi:MAG: class I SAM-dependent methyltransferase [Kiritimatiellae bacterium]|jgi:SAM-dependent methyltransferase|nr:class I SAM-dependent methyltransferase [Kiritimatiellia bacterium]
MNSPTRSMQSIRDAEKRIRKTTCKFILNKALNKTMRQTRHIREWYHRPMEYARIMELPLTTLMLDAKTDDKILDISSPKLLSLYYALDGYKNVIAADLEKYFVDDFNTYKKDANLKIDTSVFDASKKIPFPDATFDKIFSISVLEHIPNNGDNLALKEMLRVLKPTGTIVITLPVYKEHIEEWITEKDYWKTIEDDNGKSFFQRRYDKESFFSRFTTSEGHIEEVILIAEKPIKPAEISSTGKLFHNSMYLMKTPIYRIAGKLRFIPFIEYYLSLHASKKYHYITTDWSDPNIRQIAVKITKATQ